MREELFKELERELAHEEDRWNLVVLLAVLMISALAGLALGYAMGKVAMMSEELPDAEALRAMVYSAESRTREPVEAGSPEGMSYVSELRTQILSFLAEQRPTIVTPFGNRDRSMMCILSSMTLGWAATFIQSAPEESAPAEQRAEYWQSCFNSLSLFSDILHDLAHEFGGHDGDHG